MYDSDDPTSPITIDVCLESRDSIYMTSDTANAALAEGRVDARDFAALSAVSGIICWIKPSTQTIVGCFDLSINRVVPKPAG